MRIELHSQYAGAPRIVVAEHDPAGMIELYIDEWTPGAPFTEREARWLQIVALPALLVAPGQPATLPTEPEPDGPPPPTPAPEREGLF